MLQVNYHKELFDNDYSDEYIAAFPPRQEARMTREWTKSAYVRSIFDAVYGICAFDHPMVSLDDSIYLPQWDKNTSIGYINPKNGRSAWGVDDPIIRPHLEWDVRFHTAIGNKSPKTGEISPNAMRRHHRELPDLPECYTDYGDTIFVIDNPAILDVLIATGHYKMPKSSKREVFLAMSPTFVESHPEISDIVDAAKENGDVFDIRDWYERKLIEPADDGYWKKAINWLGEMPDEIAEPKLAAKLSDVVSSARGSVITGYKNDKWGRIKDVNDCLNVANALALDREFISLPTIAKGKKLSTSGKWSKFERNNQIFFKGNGYSKQMREIDRKIDELADIIRFWKNARDEYRFSILLDERDFSNADFVFEKISVLGELIGVDIYVDTYKFGVPADDILA